MTHIDKAFDLLKQLRHVPITPANQYCAICGCALFTKKGAEPCKGYPTKDTNNG